MLLEVNSMSAFRMNPRRLGERSRQSETPLLSTAPVLPLHDGPRAFGSLGLLRLDVGVSGFGGLE